MNDGFLDAMSCMSFAIGLVNYKENLEQSTNDDLMRAIDKRTRALMSDIKSELDKHNCMLEEILKRLDNDSRRSVQSDSGSHGRGSNVS